jgi:hypothetical protein
MNDKQIQDAYNKWAYKHYGAIETDNKVEPFLNKSIKGFSLGTSWLRQARNALLLSTEFVAQKLNVSRSSYAKLEKSE